MPTYTLHLDKKLTPFFSFNGTRVALLRSSLDPALTPWAYRGAAGSNWSLNTAWVRGGDLPKRLVGLLSPLCRVVANHRDRRSGCGGVQVRKIKKERRLRFNLNSSELFHEGEVESPLRLGQAAANEGVQPGLNLSLPWDHQSSLYAFWLVSPKSKPSGVDSCCVAVHCFLEGENLVVF